MTLTDLVRSDVRWLPVPGYEGRYEVSDDGRIYSLATGRFLKGGKTSKGYAKVNLGAGDGVFHSHRLHVLIAEAFLGPRPPGMHTCHNDGDKLNNSVSNLRYATPLENAQDKDRHGRPQNQHALKTHCAKGHPFDEANTRWRPTGHRACRACEKAYGEIYEATRRRR